MAPNPHHRSLWRRLTHRLTPHRGSDTTAEAYYGRQGPNTAWNEHAGAITGDELTDHTDHADHSDQAGYEEPEPTAEQIARHEADLLAADAGHAATQARHARAYGSLSPAWDDAQAEWAAADQEKPGLPEDVAARVQDWEHDADRPITGAELRWLRHQLQDQAHDADHAETAGTAADNDGTEL